MEILSYLKKRGGAGQILHGDVVSVAARIRALRSALGLTQKQVAEQSGVSVMTIVRFEKGQGNAIRLNNLIALMRAIQRLDDIVELVPEMPPSLYHKTRKR